MTLEQRRATRAKLRSLQDGRDYLCRIYEISSYFEKAHIYTHQFACRDPIGAEKCSEFWGTFGDFLVESDVIWDWKLDVSVEVNAGDVDEEMDGDDEDVGGDRDVGVDEDVGDDEIVGSNKDVGGDGDVCDDDEQMIGGDGGVRLFVDDDDQYIYDLYLREDQDVEKIPVALKDVVFRIVEVDKTGGRFTGKGKDHPDFHRKLFPHLNGIRLEIYSKSFFS